MKYFIGKIAKDENIWKSYLDRYREYGIKSGGPDSDYDALPKVARWMRNTPEFGERFEDGQYVESVEIKYFEKELFEGYLEDIYEEALNNPQKWDREEVSKLCDIFEATTKMEENESGYVIGD